MFKGIGDPALRIGFDRREFCPVSVEGCIYTFVIPPHPSDIRIISRSKWNTSAESDDRRRLGVAIGRIVLRDSAHKREVPIDHPMLRKGFHASECQGSKLWRWSDGDAHLPIVLLERGGCMPKLLEVHLHAKLPAYEAEA